MTLLESRKTLQEGWKIEPVSSVPTSDFIPFDTIVKNPGWEGLPGKFQINAYADQVRAKLREKGYLEELYSVTDEGYAVYPRVSEMTLVKIDGFRPLPQWNGPKDRQDKLISLFDMMGKASFFPGSPEAMPLLTDDLHALLTALSFGYLNKQVVNNRMLINEVFGTSDYLFSSINRLRDLLQRYTNAWTINRVHIRRHVGTSRLVPIG
ncbi:MAG TPA: hypothetical protein VMR81_04880 [Patescibacteria group bacterium]|nr:hypothetical protein [Patescibacteria group bacterium]